MKLATLILLLSSTFLFNACSIEGGHGLLNKEKSTHSENSNVRERNNITRLSDEPITLTEIGRYTTGVFNKSAAEIIGYDTKTKRLFVVNANAGQIDVLSIADPTTPSLVATIDASINWNQAGVINSVDVKNNIVAAGVQNKIGSKNGKLMLYNANSLNFLGASNVGNLPDSVAFTPDGKSVVVANEGEPLNDYSIDPEGSISIVNVSNPKSPSSTHIDFSEFNGQENKLRASGIRIYGNANRSAYSVKAFTESNPATITVSDATGIKINDIFTLASTVGEPINYRVVKRSLNTLTLNEKFNVNSKVSNAGTAGLTIYLHNGTSSASQDFEPEYVSISPDGKTAGVTLQENNAIIFIDIASATIDKLVPLGTKNHMLTGNGLDVSDKDKGINITNWPIKGLYLPDTIASYEQFGETFYLTANEGDTRAYDGYVEELRFKDAKASGIVNVEGPLISPLFADSANLGRLLTTLTSDTDGNGFLDEPYSIGARSFSIWDKNAKLIFDSGHDFESISSNIYGEDFNNDNVINDPDSRSDAKGPEPEALAIGQIKGRFYAFIGLERMGGIMVYDITNPYSPSFVQYINKRDFTFDFKKIIEGSEAGDLGPECLKFISAEDSPNNKALLIVANEVSGTTTIYEISH